MLWRNLWRVTSIPRIVQHMTRNWATHHKAEVSMIPSGGMNSAAIAMKDATRKAPMANRGFVQPVSMGLYQNHLYRSFG